MQCDSKLETNSSAFSFSDSIGFGFKETLDNFLPFGGFKAVLAAGEVHIRPYDQAEEGAPVRVDVQWWYENNEVMNLTSIEHIEDTLRINVPARIPGAPFTKTCLYVYTNIWIGPNQKLDQLNIQTDFPSVYIHDGLNFTSDELVIKTGSGGIQSPLKPSTSAINSREIRLRTISGSIKGNYPLNDLLWASSVSGSIDLTISPKNGTKQQPKSAAILECHTLSGSINIDVPNLSSSIPERDYKSQITTNSGSLTASLPHGRQTYLHTSSGSIDAALSPISSELSISNRSDIAISSSSGSVNFRLSPSLSHPSKPLKYLFSRFDLPSGSSKITYPTTWEGKVDGKLGSGSLNVNWPGLEVERDEKSDKEFWGPTRIFEAKKGEGQGILRFRGRSGSVELRG